MGNQEAGSENKPRAKTNLGLEAKTEEQIGRHDHTAIRIRRQTRLKNKPRVRTKEEDKKRKVS